MQAPSPAVTQQPVPSKNIPSPSLPFIIPTKTSVTHHPPTPTLAITGQPLKKGEDIACFDSVSCGRMYVSFDIHWVLQTCGEKAILIDLTSSETIQLKTKDYVSFAAFSPDSKKILVFESKPEYRTDLWLFELEQLQTPQYLGNFWGATRVIWAPDSQQFALTYEESDVAISVLGLKGETKTLVTLPEMHGPMLPKYDMYTQGPTWSPDSKKLAYTFTIRGDSEVITPFQLWVVDIEKGTKEKLYEGDKAGEARYPEWSPDGKNIGLYIDNVTLAYYNIASSRLIPLFQADFRSVYFWFPDGNGIWYFPYDNIIAEIQLDSKERPTYYEDSYNIRPMLDNKGLIFANSRNDKKKTTYCWFRAE